MDADKTISKLDITEKGFDFHYSNVVENSLKEIRETRHNRKIYITDKIFYICSSIAILGLVFLFGQFFTIATSLGVLFIIALIISPTIRDFQFAKIDKNYETGMIQKVLVPSTQYFLDDFSVEENMKLQKKTLDETLLPNLNKNKLHYLFSFTHKGNKVQGSNLYSEFDKRGNWLSKLLCTVVVFEVPKHFQGRTVILKRKNSSWFHRFRKSDFFNSENQVELESWEFNETFTVYSESQIEARYLLDPALMERLIELDKADRKHLSFAFYKNHLFVSIPFYRDLFAYSWWDELNWKEYIFERVDDVLYIARMVDQLGLIIDYHEDLNEEGHKENEE